MSGFSPEWLALREPADHRSRSDRLLQRLGERLDGKSRIAIVDLGCGSGSNLRATAPRLPIPEQHWTLVDYDPRLLAAAGLALASWAEHSETRGETLVLGKAGKQIVVSFRQADLVADLERALGEAPELVTASAFFDLCSAAFIEQLAAAVARRRALFLTVLTYNGEQSWQPAHPADARMAAAFHAHQTTDKGFGAAAGPGAPAALAKAFRAAGYQVEEADTPWRLGPADARLVGELAVGFSGAVGETGRVPGPDIESWANVVRTSSIVGHTDTLACPKDRDA